MVSGLDAKADPINHIERSTSIERIGYSDVTPMRPLMLRMGGRCALQVLVIKLLPLH